MDSHTLEGLSSEGCPALHGGFSRYILRHEAKLLSDVERQLVSLVDAALNGAHWRLAMGDHLHHLLTDALVEFKRDAISAQTESKQIKKLTRSER